MFNKLFLKKIVFLYKNERKNNERTKKEIKKAKIKLFQ